MRGFLHAVPIIARERGIRGFFQGFVPTTLRQSANSATRFGSYTFFKQEGVLTFWSGALPRLARLVMSGGIVFTMYEKSMELMDRLDPESRYI